MAVPEASVIEIGEEGKEWLRSLANCSDGEGRALAEAVVSVLVSEQREDAALDAPVFEALEVDLIKRLYSALACLFVEAAKSDASVKLVAAFLCGQCGLTEARAEVVAVVFGNGKDRLRAELTRTGDYSSISRLTAVDWRLQHRVGKEGERDLLYHVVLKTGEPSGHASGKSAFVCSVEQLQDLVATLKDACKAVERSVHQG